MNNQTNRTTILARSIGHSMLKLTLHPSLYFFCLTISFLHILLCNTENNNALYGVLKWFDPSLYLSPFTILFVIGPGCVIVAVILVLHLGWVDEISVQESLTKHYLVKIALTFAFFMSYSICLIIIRSSFAILTTDNSTQMGYEQLLAYKIMTVVTLVCYLLIIYIYSMFLLTDLSPQHNIIFSYIDFPNSFTIINIYRPICFLLSSISQNNQQADSNSQLILSICLFLILSVYLVKYPIITWNYNKISQLYFSSILWVVLCRILGFIGMGGQYGFGIGVLGLGFAVFGGFVIWVLHKRVLYVIKRDKNTVMKFKIVYYLLVNHQDYQDQLDVFLITHFKGCKVNNCCCHKIFEQIHEQKRLNQTIQQNTKVQQTKTKFAKRIQTRQVNKSTNKSKQGQSAFEHSASKNKYQQLKKKQRYYWFKLFYQLQNEQFMIDKIRQLPVTQKDIKLKKVRQIILDQVQVLHYHLDKQYQSLRNLWLFAEEMRSSSTMSLFFLSRFCIEEYNQEQTIKKKSKEEGSNQYALNFYELQTKLLHFRDLLLKSTIKTEYFWHELSSSQPDQKKIIKAIHQVLRTRLSISSQLKKYQKKIAKTSSINSQYEQNWDLKIKSIIQKSYRPFQVAMQLASDGKIAEISSYIAEKQSKKMEKNLVFYDCQASTGMGIVNIQEGEDFGLITTTNREFWELFNYSRFEKPRINHFLVKQMHSYHDRTIVNFLRQNKHFLSFHAGFVIDDKKLLIQVQFSVQLLPHVYNGLFAAAFLQQVKSSKSIFLTNKASNIISYNKKFKQLFLQNENKNHNLQEFDEIINKEVIQKLENERKCVVNIGGEDYVVQNYHWICCSQGDGLGQLENLYFVEIHQDWDFIPLKTAKIQVNQKEQFYNNNSKIESVKRASRLNTQRIQLKNQQKQQFQNLMGIIKNQKKGKNLNRWNNFTTVLLIIIFLLVICCSGLTQLKKGYYVAFGNSINSLTNFIQNTAQSVFLARKINILGYTNSTSNQTFYINNLTILSQQIIQDKLQINLGQWVQYFDSFQLLQNNQITRTSTIFQMIVQRYLISANTVILNNINSMNFDYVKSQISLPYQNIYLSFLNLIYNTFYIVLPIMRDYFRGDLQSKWLQKINVPVPITPVSIIIIFIGAILLIFTIVLRLKILKLLQRTLKLIQKLEISYIQERIQILRMYSKTNFSDLYDSQKSKEKIYTKLQLNKQKNKSKKQVSKHEQTQIGIQIKRLIKQSKQKKDQIIDNLNCTSRQLALTSRQTSFLPSSVLPVNPSQNSQTPKKTTKKLTQKPSQKSPQIPKQKPKRAPTTLLSIQNLQKSRMVLISTLGILPILILSLVSIGMQSYYTNHITMLLSIKELYFEKLESINLVKSYLFEMGYESAEFVGQDFSIGAQIPAIIQRAYLVERKIQESQGLLNGNYFITQVQEINSKYFCDILNFISQDTYIPTCNAIQFSKYQQKTKSQVLVQYFQTARSLYNEYVPSTPYSLTVAQQRQYSKDIRHRILQKLNLHLKNIEQHMVGKFIRHYRQNIKMYQLTMILIFISFIPILVLIRSFWVRFEMREMELQIRKIKTVILLISEVHIQGNLQLKNQFMSMSKMFEILA